jgi:hypothetical protein
MLEPAVLQRRLGALSGGLTGLALAAGLWGPGALGLRLANMPLYYASLLLGGLGALVVGALAGWLAARASRLLLAGLIWLAAACLIMLMAGHLPFEGRTLLAWLADRRFWGLPIYPFDDTAQTRLVVGSLLPALMLTALGLVQDYRLEGIQSSLNAQRLGPRAWLLLLLPMALVVGAGLAANDAVNQPLDGPVAQVAQIITVGQGYNGDLDALSRQTGLNYSSIASVRPELAGGFRLMLGEAALGDEKVVVVVANFDSGAWINCRVLVDQVSFCQDAAPPYVTELKTLLAGQDPSQCADCQVQVSPTWQAWLRDRGPRVGAPQISRLAQQGSYVLMRAASPAGGYALDCLFQGNRTISLERCQEE